MKKRTDNQRMTLARINALNQQYMEDTRQMAQIVASRPEPVTGVRVAVKLAIKGKK